MFIPYHDPSVRATGRWAVTENRSLSATATGSYLEIAFQGPSAVLNFDMSFAQFPWPHLWISVDGGPRVEVPLDWHLRIDAGEGNHTVKVIYKSAAECQHRWHHPLVGRVAFLGYDAEGPAQLSPDPRKTIELVGDSITEGVLIDTCYHEYRNYYFDEVFMDDVCATYAYLTAEALNLRPLHCGYGAVGITRGGQGGVPRVSQSYPYCFEKSPVPYDHPDYILINHGANDRHKSCEEYVNGYRDFLAQVRSAHPHAKIIVLSAFCGVHPKGLGEMVAQFNADNNDDIFFVDSTGWISPEPLHPLRDGHKTVAANLIPLLKEKYNL